MRQSFVPLPSLEPLSTGGWAGAANRLIRANKSRVRGRKRTRWGGTRGGPEWPGRLADRPSSESRRKSKQVSEGRQQGQTWVGFRNTVTTEVEAHLWRTQEHG